MYSTKTIHKNLNPGEKGSYTSIGDPYRSTNSSAELPSRWKEKQFVTQKFPKNAENGLFVKLQYNSEPYTEISEKYSKTQPTDSRKLGFGSRDASKTGEFTCWKTTERYRSVVKQENKLMESHRDEAKEREILKQLPADNAPVPPKDRDGKSLTMPMFMYDVGRNTNSFSRKGGDAYDPKSTRDCFYSLPKHAKGDIRRLGTHRPSSAAIGQYAWSAKYSRPEFGSQNGGAKFYDRGHLEVSGF